MVDLATLTGACMVALGNYTAGVFSNSDKLKEKLLGSSKVSGEKMWHLPLDEELRPGIDSHIADYYRKLLVIKQEKVEQRLPRCCDSFL